MTEYFKAVRPDGTDFRTGTVQWVPEGGVPEGGHVVAHPDDGKRLTPGRAATYLSVATVAAECTEMEWPCRVLRVVPDEREVQCDPDEPYERCSTRWRVVEEVDAHLALGPQGVEVAAIVERTSRLTPSEIQTLDAAAWEAARGAVWGAARGAAWEAAWGAAWEAARDAALGAAWDTTRSAAWGVGWDAARSAAWGAAWDATRGAVLGTLVRDLISDEQYSTLMAPWRKMIAND